MARFFLLVGFICLIVVVLIHVAERLQLLPAMGWGLPDSPGHWLDLISAASGTVALLIGGASWVLRSE